MSLLMDALKKAERAKQEHTDPADENLEMQIRPESSERELRLEPSAHQDPPDNESSPKMNVQHASTSGQEDIFLFAESVPADTEPTLAQSRIKPLPDASARPSATENRRTTPAIDAKKIAMARQRANSVFAAKQPVRNRTFLLTGATAAIIIGGIACGVYYWQTLARTIPPQPTQMAQQTPQPRLVTPAAVAENSPLSKGESPPSPKMTLSHASSTAETAPPRPATAATASLPEEKPVAMAYSGNQAIQIRQSKATSQLNPMLAKAYQSFLAGDIETAQQQYSKALQQEPNNRDALLGLAAIALNRKQAGQATAYYLKLLELNPADPEALAGLVGLQGQADPVQSESRLKKILAQNPQAGAVHFALGNVYTQQSRWAEAQQSYFRAYSSAPSNADYAYNLAVSLDHLGQGKLAAEYYQRAITLSQSGPANFDHAAAQDRSSELQPTTGN